MICFNLNGDLGAIWHSPFCGIAVRFQALFTNRLLLDFAPALTFSSCLRGLEIKRTALMNFLKASQLRIMARVLLCKNWRLKTNGGVISAVQDQLLYKQDTNILNQFEAVSIHCKNSSSALI
jgi:hypothetical protein